MDYCQRARRAGLRVLYFPDATVIHHIGRSAVALPGRAIVARHRGMWRYYAAYLRPRMPVARQALDAAVLAGILLRAGAQLAVISVGQALKLGKAGRKGSVAVWPF